jgi:DNA polymerase delta subunit 2
VEDRGEILERLLRWRHVAPTAPDTLAAYPYYDADPFILEATPHVLFAGGQPQFGTRVVRGEGGQSVRVVAVPAFSASGCVVLVNLATLACHPMHFDASLRA